MNAIRESVRHDMDVAYRAEERARRREELGLKEGEDDEEGEGDEIKEDPVPAITKAHFEVRITSDASDLSQWIIRNELNRPLTDLCLSSLKTQGYVCKQERQGIRGDVCWT